MPNILFFLLAEMGVHTEKIQIHAAFGNSLQHLLCLTIRQTNWTQA